MRKLIQHPSYIGGLIVSLITLLIYVYSAAPYYVGTGNIDPLLLAAKGFNATDYPVYPLYTVLVKIFLFLPIPGSVAFKAHVLNSILHSLAVAALYTLNLIIIRIIYQAKNSDGIQSVLPIFRNGVMGKQDEILAAAIAASGSLFVAFSRLIWYSNSIVDVYSLHDLLVTLTLLAALLWSEKALAHPKGQLERYYFFSTALLFGLSFSTLSLLVISLPVLIIAYYRIHKNTDRQKTYGLVYLIQWLGIAGAGFILPHVLFIVFYPNTLSLVFKIPIQLYNNIILQLNEFVFRQSFLIIVSQYLKNVFLYWQILFQNITLVGLLLGLGGFAGLWFKQRPLFKVLFALTVISCLFYTLTLSGLIEQTSRVQPVQMLIYFNYMSLSPEIIWGISITAGLWIGMSISYRRILRSWKKRIYVTSLIPVFTIGWLLFSNNDAGIQRKNTVANDYAHNILAYAASDAVIISFNDFTYQSLKLAQEAEEMRPDVHLISQNIQRKPGRKLDLYGFSYSSNPYYISDVLSWNIYKNRPVYLTDVPSDFISYFGLDGNPFFLIPDHYLFRVVTKIPSGVEKQYYLLSERIPELLPGDQQDPGGIKKYFADYHTLNGIIYSHLNIRQEARKNFLLALTLQKDHPVAKELNANLAGYEGDPQYALGSVGLSASDLLQKGIDNINKNRLQEAYPDIRKATYIGPLDRQARYSLASLYRSGSYYEEAAGEYRNILQYYPDDVEVKKLLQEIETIQTNQQPGGNL